MNKVSQKSYGFALVVWITPWLLLALFICFNQGLAKTLFTTPIGLQTTAAVLVWETIGCFLLTWGLPTAQPLDRRGFYVKISPKVALVIAVFVLPAFLLPMLAPVLITLLESGAVLPNLQK